MRKLKRGMKLRFTAKLNTDTEVFICCIPNSSGVRLVNVDNGKHWGLSGYKTLEKLNTTSLGIFEIVKEEV